MRKQKNIAFVLAITLVISLWIPINGIEDAYAESKDKISLEAIETNSGNNTNGQLWSMTTQKDIRVTITFDEPVQDTAKLEWYFGKQGENLMQLDQWKTYKKEVPLFEFIDEPLIDKENQCKVTATIRTGLYFDDVDGTETRSNRGVFPELIGDYTFKVINSDNEESAEKAVVWNIYDEYVMFDDMEGTVNQIIEKAISNGLYATREQVGFSTLGEPIYCVIVSDEQNSVESYLQLVEESKINPQGIADRINDSTLTNYRVPILINNTHADENPGLDAQVEFLKKLAEAGAGGTISYSTIENIKAGNEESEKIVQEIESKFAKEVKSIVKPEGSYQFEVNPAAPNYGVDYKKQNFTNIYNVKVEEFKVDEILDDVIFICNLTLNPDGRKSNNRQNTYGFDPNRDNMFQTQQEAKNMSKLTAKWQPISFLDLHGFVREFLIEPCTPPHEPNLEYDLMQPFFIEGGQAYGNAALATSDKYTSYLMPIRDWFDGTKWFEPWDDMATNYTPSYAMFHGCLAGYTIECPELNSDSVKLFESGFYGVSKYISENKKQMYLNQLEYFNRGVNNSESVETEKWFVDQENNVVSDFRTKVNGKFYPEYWVIPSGVEAQRDIASVEDIKEFFDLNDIKYKKLTQDVTVDNNSFKAGDVVVDMHQSKRSLANVVLYNGKDISDWSGLYSESVVAFPELRGFNAYPIYEKDAFSGKLGELTESLTTVIKGSNTANNIVIDNNGVEAVKAVNTLLGTGKSVSLITEGVHKGDFLVSKADFDTVKESFVLEAYSYDIAPTSSVISKPKIYIVGERETAWLNASNEKNSHDNFAIKNQMGFDITKNIDEATIIVGSSSVASDLQRTIVENKIKAGTPYIAMGALPLKYVKSNILTSGFNYNTDSSSYESLFKVKYGDSIITKNYIEDKDERIYSKSGSYITEVPKGAIVLVSAVDSDDFHISGCYTNVRELLKGKTEAISYNDGKLDVTIFANSITNKGHQQDDYRFLSTAIYAKAAKVVEQGDFSNSSSGGGKKHSSNTSTGASISLPKGAVANVGNSNGTVSFNTSSAKQGEKVTVTIKCNPSYEVSKVTVKDSQGKKINCSVNDDGTYSFVMPASKITVDVEFAASFSNKKETPSFNKTVLSKQNVTLNGKEINMDAYNVDGYNYMKLRDIAFLMNDTKAKFEVKAGGNYIIEAHPGKSYTQIGGELVGGTDNSNSCVVSKWIISIDGIQRHLYVYNIGGNNYFKLRDLGELFEFDVQYDSSTNTAKLMTN